MDERCIAGQHARYAVDFRYLKRLFGCHVRQYRWRCPREERFSRTRRTDHYHVVSAGPCHLQRALHVLLPPDIAEIHAVRDVAIRRYKTGLANVSLDRVDAAQVGGKLDQRCNWTHFYAVDESGFCSVRLGYVNTVETSRPR